jgi:hypothetical protein
MDKPEQFLSRREQARRYNDCSVKTVERWGQNPKLNFPPEYDINGRKFRKLSELEAWERERASVAATTPRKRRPATTAESVS